MLYLTEAGYYGHVLSKNLPLDLDNRLYTIIHVIGGMNFEEIISFANNASPEEIQHLNHKVLEFPSTMEGLLPYAGEFGILKDSDEYKEIKDIINFRKTEDNTLQEQAQPKWDPTFNEIIPPHLKEKLFNYWTKLGKAEWGALKLFGVKEEDHNTDFDDVIDIVYPVLRIEWEGGIDKTILGLKKDEWRHAITHGAYDIRFKAIPTSYTYSWAGGGKIRDIFDEQGLACWNLTYIIDDESTWNGEPITNIFPDKTTYDVLHSPENEPAEVIEELWDWIVNEGSNYFNQYCNITVKIF